MDIFYTVSSIIKNNYWHILTDIDDTLFPHPGNGNVAGSDLSWKKNEPYPGITAFYTQFYFRLPIHLKYTTILSATPGLLKDGRMNKDILHKILSYEDSPGYAFIQGTDSKRILATAWLTGNIHAYYGKIKYIRAKQYKALFPEYKLIFIGDNGQGDELAGKFMLKEKVAEYVFIHKIVNKGDTKLQQCKNEIECEKKDKKDCIPNFFCFGSYYELANKFHHAQNGPKIFTKGDIKKIRQESTEDISKICDDDKQYNKLYSYTYENLGCIKKEKRGHKQTRKTRKRRIKQKKLKNSKKKKRKNKTKKKKNLNK